MAYTKYTPFANGDSGSLIREKLNALGESVNAIGDGTKSVTDNTKAPVLHTSTDGAFGVGASGIYGHVKLSAAVNETGGVTNGTAATPSAVKTAYDKAVEALNAVGTLKTQVQNGTVVAANATNATRAASAGYADSSGSCSGNAATASRIPVANVGNCRFIWDGTNLNITKG